MLSRKDYEEYQQQIIKSKKVDEMATFTDNAILAALEEAIAKCPIETISKEEEKSTKSAMNSEKKVMK